MAKKTAALVLPSDTPPRRSRIKRLLLFFDSVLLIDPSDAAILNDGDLFEVFPNGRTIRPGPLGPFPVSPDYADSFRALSAETSKLQGRGLLRFLKPPPPSRADPRVNWIASVGASKDEALLRSALPDHRAGEEPVYLQRGGYVGVVMSDEHYPSKNSWLLGEQHAPLPDVDLMLSRLAWTRMGRCLKAIRRAHLEGAVPVALDPVSTNMSVSLGTRCYPSPPSPGDLAHTAMALDAVDPRELDAALANLGWDEVARLRKEVLPHAARLRQVLVDHVRSTRSLQNAGLEPYAAALAGLRSKQQAAMEQYRDAWRKLGFTAVGAGISGLSAISLPSSLALVVVALAATVVAGSAKTAPADIHRIVTARTKRRANPLFFFYGLPGRIEKSQERTTD